MRLAKSFIIEGVFMGNHSSAVKHFDTANFTESVSKGVVLVDFYADWCGPCRMMTPILENLATELNDKVTIGKVDIDASGDVASSFGITSIPTLILFKNGQEVNRIVGLKDANSLKKIINSNL